MAPLSWILWLAVKWCTLEWSFRGVGRAACWDLWSVLYSEGQLPRPDNDCKLGGVYCTAGYCLGTKENDRRFWHSAGLWFVRRSDACGCTCTYSAYTVCPLLQRGAGRLCPLVELRSHLSQCAQRPTHLHRRFMTPVCKKVCVRGHGSGPECECV